MSTRPYRAIGEIDQLRWRVGRSQVAGKAAGGAASGGDVPFYGGQSLLVAGAQHARRALARKSDGDGAADAAIRARDDCGFMLERHADWSSPRIIRKTVTPP